MTTMNLDDSVFITKKTVTITEYAPDFASQAGAGSTAITLSSSANFAAGDYAYISETFGSIGELVKIVSVSGNTVYIQSGLGKTYSTDYNLYKADFTFSSSGDVIKIRPTSVEWGMKKEYTFQQKTVSPADWGVKDSTPTASDRLKHTETWNIKGFLIAEDFTAHAKQEFLRLIMLGGGTVWFWENFGSDRYECMIDNVKITKEEGPISKIVKPTPVERYRYGITIDLKRANQK